MAVNKSTLQRKQSNQNKTNAKVVRKSDRNYKGKEVRYAHRSPAKKVGDEVKRVGGLVAERAQNPGRFVHEDYAHANTVASNVGQKVKSKLEDRKPSVKSASGTKKNPKAKSLSAAQSKAATVRSTSKVHTRSSAPWATRKARDEVFGGALRKRDEKKAATKGNTTKVRTTK